MEEHGNDTCLSMAEPHVAVQATVFITDLKGSLSFNFLSLIIFKKSHRAKSSGHQSKNFRVFKSVWRAMSPPTERWVGTGRWNLSPEKEKVSEHLGHIKMLWSMDLCYYLKNL